jgi:hypothetical protein
MLETEINTHLDVLKTHLRSVTREGEAPKTNTPAPVVDSIDFLWKYFKHPKNRSKYPDKLSETKRILKIGAEQNMIGEFNIEKLKFQDENIQKSSSMVSDRSKKEKSQFRGVRLSVDLSQQGEHLDTSKPSMSLTSRDKEDILHTKVMEEMQNFQKNREAMTLNLAAKKKELGKSVDKAETLSTASAPVIEKEINGSTAGGHVASTLPMLSKKSVHQKQADPPAPPKPAAEQSLRRLLRLAHTKGKNSSARARPQHPPVPHSFYSMLDQSREHTRATSANRAAVSVDRVVKLRDRPQKGPFYDLLFR